MRRTVALSLLAIVLPFQVLAQTEQPDPLTEAVLYQDQPAVATLLGKGASANTMYNGRSLLGWAAQSGSLAIVELIVAAGAQLDVVDGVGHTPLMRAAETRKTEIVTFLLAKGADVNAADKEGDTILLNAVEDSNLELVPILLAAKADPKRANADGRTPLMSAVQYHYADLVSPLVKAGADVNARTILGPPLIMALADGDEATVKAVLDAGADPNARSEYGTPALIGAIEGGLPPGIVALLIARKADVNTRDRSESTALHAAARARDLAIVTSLIAAGADVNAAQSNGETPIQTARYNGAPDELVAALIGAGAKE